jgi:hypothetical protein
MVLNSNKKRKAPKKREGKFWVYFRLKTRKATAPIAATATTPRAIASSVPITIPVGSDSTGAEADAAGPTVTHVVADELP